MEAKSSFMPHGAPIHEVRLLPVLAPKQVIGRNRELAAMHTSIKNGKSVFLSGQPGIGKTTLAAVLASAYTATHPGGVIWFNVTEDSFEMLIARIARAYGIYGFTLDKKEHTDEVDKVRSLLRQHRPMIVLDGLLDPEAILEFVEVCLPETAVIAIGETPLEGAWMRVELEPLSIADSQNLLRQVSGLQEAIYQADIEGLSKFLGGIPLAIDLAARQVALDDMTPAELMVAMPSSVGGQDSPMMVMSLLFKRLPPPVQAVLIMLSALISASATTELISDLTDITPTMLAPLLRDLIRRGLARETVLYGQPAYTLHEGVQNYVRSWLTQYQRLRGAESRALKAILTYLERHATPTIADHERLAAEMINVMNAGAYATSNGDVTSLKQIIDAITQNAGDFVTQRGFQPEVVQLTKLAKLLEPPAAARAATSRAATQPAQGSLSELPTQPARPLWLSAATQFGPVPGNPKLDEPHPDLQATPVLPARPAPIMPPNLPDSANVALTQPATPIPTQLPEETQVVAAYEGSNASSESGATEPVSIRSVVETQAVVAETPVQPDDTDKLTPPSAPNLQKRLQIARDTGDTATEAKLLQAIGQYYAEQKKRPEALDHLKQALERYETLNDTDGMVAVLEALTTLTVQTDDAEGAVLYATRGINLARQLGDKARLGRMQIRLADVRRSIGELQNAIQGYTEAAETLRSTEDWFSVGVAMFKLGDAFLEDTQFREAIMMLEQALVIFYREQRGDYAGRTLGNIGLAYEGLQQYQKAQGYAEQSLTLARQNGDRVAESTRLGDFGRIRQTLGDRDGALLYYRQALHVAYQVEDHELQSEFARCLGTLLIEQPITIQMGLNLLRESEALLPRAETRQLISRATKRIERASAARLPIPPAGVSTRDYAAEAYPKG